MTADQREKVIRTLEIKYIIKTSNDLKELKHNSPSFITLTIFELRSHHCSLFFLQIANTLLCCAAREILDGTISAIFGRIFCLFSLFPFLCLLFCLAKGGNCISCLLCCARESNLIPFLGGAVRVLTSLMKPVKRVHSMRGGAVGEEARGSVCQGQLLSVAVAAAAFLAAVAHVPRAYSSISPPDLFLEKSSFRHQQQQQQQQKQKEKQQRALQVFCMFQFQRFSLSY